MPETNPGVRLPSRIGDYRWGLQSEGLLLFILLFAIGLAAYNTGNNLLFLFVAVMATVIVTHSVLNLFSREGHIIERGLPAILIAGQPFTVSLRLRSKKRFFTSHCILLQEDRPELLQSGRAFFYQLRPGRVAVRHYEAILPRRGRYRFGPIWLRSRFPFGLSMQSMRYVIPGEAIVYPAIHPVRPRFAAAASIQGVMERPNKGFGFNLFGLREHQEGESSRLIHWKTSAKMDRLMVREFEDEQSRRVSVLFENLLTGDTERDREIFEQRVSEAASHAAHLIEEGWQVELVTLSGQIPFGQGGWHLDRMLRHLALIEPVSMARDAARRQLQGGAGAEQGFTVRVSTLFSELQVHANPLSAPPWRFDRTGKQEETIFPGESR